MPKSMFQSRRGFSGLGVIMARDMIPSWRTRHAATSFAEDLEEARALAILHDREAVVEVTDYDPAPYADSATYGAWAVSVGDASHNATFFDVLPFEETTGVDAYHGEGLHDIQKGGNLYLKGVSMLKPDVATIVFDPRGWVANDNSDFTHSDGGAMEFVFVNTVADDQNDAWKVLVFRGGMIRLAPTHGKGFDNLGGGIEEQSGY